MTLEQGSRIYVADHCGLVGSAIVRKLLAEGYTNLILRTSQELDIREQQAVYQAYIGCQSYDVA